MRTSDIIADYRATIDVLSRELKRAGENREELDRWQEKAALRKAAIIAAGIEGTNAEIRAANLTITLASDVEYGEVIGACVQVRRRIDNAETQIAVARESCRLLRLQLALSASPAVLEAVA